MDTLTDLHEARMAAVLDTLHTTRTLDRLERRDWLVFRRIASLVEGLPIADVAEGEPELYGHWLDALARWRGLGLGHMTLAAVEREMETRGVAR